MAEALRVPHTGADGEKYADILRGSRDEPGAARVNAARISMPHASARVDAADALSCRPDFSLLIYPWRLVEDEEHLNVTSAHPPAFLAQAEKGGLQGPGSKADVMAPHVRLDPSNPTATSRALGVWEGGLRDSVSLEVLPNRDSLPYADVYGIAEHAERVFRGTLRYAGWSRFTQLCNVGAAGPGTFIGGSEWEDVALSAAELMVFAPLLTGGVARL